MTAYVDELRDYPKITRIKRLPSTHWAHLTADTREELHAFAARLGLRRAWFQDHETRWHYDLTSGKRAAAVRLGAREITWREMAAVTLARQTSNTLERS